MLRTPTPKFLTETSEGHCELRCGTLEKEEQQFWDGCVTLEMTWDNLRGYEEDSYL